MSTGRRREKSSCTWTRCRGWKASLRDDPNGKGAEAVLAGKAERIGWLNGLVVGTREATGVIDPQSLDRVPDHARVLVSHAHGYNTYWIRPKRMKQTTPVTRDIHDA